MLAVMRIEVENGRMTVQRVFHAGEEIDMAKKKKGPHPGKAKKILRDGKVKGKKLTPKQRKFFGAKSRGK